MLHRDADARDSDPAAEAHENRLAAGLDQLYDISIHADSRHRHNDKELGQRLERRKHACRYADRGAHRGDDGREHEVQDKHRERALEREGFAALALLGLGLVGALYSNRRKVKWLKHLPRTAFSQGALHEVGSALSFFQVKNYADEYLKALDKDFKGNIMEPDTDETVAKTADEIIEATRDFILKELSKNLKGYDLEPFVANLLQAMGYRTILSPHGGDSGIDITAYKDELPPRIVVQVKSQDGDIKETTIQSLKGAMREGDYGLFVTLSNYTQNAQKYLDSTPIIRGINGTELVDLVLKYYDQLSIKYRKMIPLKMVYIPVPPEE